MKTREELIERVAEYKGTDNWKIQPSELSYELWMQLFIDKANREKPYTVEDNNRHVIDALVKYFRRDDEFLKIHESFSFDKGILLRGPVGSGKTRMFKIWRDVLQAWPFGQKIQIVSTSTIVSQYNVDGDLIFTGNNAARKTASSNSTYGNWYLESDTVIDDIGAEPIGGKYQRCDVMETMFLRRYDYDLLTHGTTNLDGDQLLERYGLRVYDRLREMFNTISLTGESRRK